MENKFKGTQGKWEQEHRVIDDEGMYATEVFSRNIVICEMKWAGERVGNTVTSKRKENAKLIAAAPDLLEALLLMVELYELVQPTDGYQGDYEQAVSAIKKATE